MNAAPSLDIVIPVRNGGAPLANTLRALAESHDQDFRLLISDNHSTDKAPWKSALEAFPLDRVVLLRPPEPLGRVEHWTWAARQASAEYCKLLLVGDRLPPDHLGHLRRAFAARPDLVYTPHIILGRGNTPEEELAALRLRDELTPLSYEGYLARSRRDANLIGPLSAVTFRTEALRRALPFDSAHGWTADWRLYTAIIQQGPVVRCESTYAIQDRTIARVSSSFKGALNGIFEDYAYRRELLGLPPATRGERFWSTLRPVIALCLQHVLPRAVLRSLRLASRGTR
jgi:glycosyltransferase involved in cell wall biosynthesis